ncbi:MAG: hypothetical protein RL742_1527 [Bacteroidota bacterium]|jgi:hypothetical protein
MFKRSFLQPLLFSLTLFGFGLELAFPYLAAGHRWVFAYSDVEQEQEDYKEHTKPTKNDEDRQVLIFLTIVLPAESETHRRQAPDHSERSRSDIFLSIFSPPPNQGAV